MKNSRSCWRKFPSCETFHKGLGALQIIAYSFECYISDGVGRVRFGLVGKLTLKQLGESEINPL